MLDGGVDGRLAAGHLVEGAADLLGAGVLGEVATSAGAQRVE